MKLWLLINSRHFTRALHSVITLKTYAWLNLHKPFVSCSDICRFLCLKRPKSWCYGWALLSWICASCKYFLGQLNIFSKSSNTKFSMWLSFHYQKSHKEHQTIIDSLFDEVRNSSYLSLYYRRMFSYAWSCRR